MTLFNQKYNPNIYPLKKITKHYMIPSPSSKPPQNILTPSTNQQLALNLAQADESMAKINKMNTIKIQSVAESQNIRISIRKDKKDNTPKLQKKDSIDFAEQLSIDMGIDRILEILVGIKIQLLELGQAMKASSQPKRKTFDQYLEKQLIKYNKTLMVRELQIGALIYFIDHKKQQNFKQKYLETYSELDKFFLIPPQHCNRHVNTVILQQAFQTEIEFYQSYSEAIKTLKENMTAKKLVFDFDLDNLMRYANKLKIVNSKIATIAEVFPYACIMDKNDLFSFKKTSDRWHKLLEKSIRYKIYGDKQTVRKSFLELKSGLNLVNASMSILYNVRGKTEFSDIMQTSTKLLKCLIFKQDATHQAQVLISDPNGALAKQIWNLPQQKMVKNLLNIVLPSIAFCQQFWIPRLFTQYLLSSGKQKMPQLKIPHVQTYAKQLYVSRKYLQRLPMRINSPYVLNYTYDKNPKQPNIFQNFIQTIQGSKTQKIQKAVIYHIHGGGFISMSSFVHQTYSRVWANNLKVPIISVDYGKAPQFPFPSGLYDCFEGYMWSLHFYKQVFNVQPDKIILVGDSAGGNLVAALTNLLITLKLRIPDGLVLVYPALNLNYHNYTPSLLTSLNDMILPHTFLKICVKSYLPEGTNSLDPLVSPIQTSKQILKMYPPTRIFVGNCDPFHDDCCRLTQRLNQIQQNRAKLMIFDQFPHGFLQFDMKTQPHQACRKATKEVENALAELLKM